jgi:hypothetical protein
MPRLLHFAPKKIYSITINVLCAIQPYAQCMYQLRGMRGVGFDIDDPEGLQKTVISFA